MLGLFWELFELMGELFELFGELFELFELFWELFELCGELIALFWSCWGRSVSCSGASGICSGCSGNCLRCSGKDRARPLAPGSLIRDSGDPRDPVWGAIRKRRTGGGGTPFLLFQAKPRGRFGIDSLNSIRVHWTRRRPVYIQHIPYTPHNALRPLEHPQGFKNTSIV